MTESPDVIIGEVLPDEKVDGKKSQHVPRKCDNVAFGSFITSNDLILKDKVFAPQRTEKPFMMLSDRSAPRIWMHRSTSTISV